MGNIDGTIEITAAVMNDLFPKRLQQVQAACDKLVSRRNSPAVVQSKEAFLPPMKKPPVSRDRRF
ncbi:MAG: hypothetical protein JW913_18335 [Chitinispirillaceae bacterium]|nr:hypothetical protein [Chitinispirillaceae bacterium]